jgi:predicted DNA-binding ribbon-helix-helix protein
MPKGPRITRKSYGAKPEGDGVTVPPTAAMEIVAPKPNHTPASSEVKQHVKTRQDLLSHVTLNLSKRSLTHLEFIAKERSLSLSALTREIHDDWLARFDRDELDVIIEKDDAAKRERSARFAKSISKV